jgi:hypothetical protein
VSWRRFFTPDLDFFEYCWWTKWVVRNAIRQGLVGSGRDKGVNCLVPLQKSWSICWGRVGVSCLHVCHHYEHLSRLFKSRVRVPMRSLKFFIYLILPAALGSGVSLFCCQLYILAALSLPPQENSWYPFLSEAESIPGAIVRVERAGHLENTATSSGLESTSFQFVA